MSDFAVANNCQVKLHVDCVAVGCRAKWSSGACSSIKAETERTIARESGSDTVRRKCESCRFRPLEQVLVLQVTYDHMMHLTGIAVLSFKLLLVLLPHTRLKQCKCNLYCCCKTNESLMTHLQHSIETIVDNYTDARCSFQHHSNSTQWLSVQAHAYFFKVFQSMRSSIVWQQISRCGTFSLPSHSC